MSRAGAARRADDAARGRPRDHRLASWPGRSSGSRASRASCARLTEEIDAGDGDAYLTATIQEALRRRPVLPNAAPRLVKQPVTIGGWRLPRAGVVPRRQRLPRPPRPGDLPATRTPSGPSASSTSRPGTYTWIPFGGGRRRCLGASFAMLEMKIVLRAVLARQRAGARRRRPRAGPGGGASRSARARGARTVLRERQREPVAA